MDFEKDCFTFMMEGRIKEQVFYRSTELREAESDIQGLGASHILTHVVVGQRPNITSAGCKVIDTHLKAPGHSPSRSQPAIADDHFINVARWASIGMTFRSVTIFPSCKTWLLRCIYGVMVPFNVQRSTLYVIMFTTYEMISCECS
jgi:hypothetical protein